ncbi:MAG: hypothetical protein MJ206_02445 [Bacilli bacterium]|nr:hypothetical protein [Bacilli bacterium]
MGKIIEGHTFDEYQDKYGKKFDNGKLQFVKLEDNNKLDSKKTYWLIKDKNPGYYQVSKLKYIIPLIVLSTAAVVTAIVVPCTLLLSAQEVKVNAPSFKGLTYSNQKAYVGKDFDTNITVDTSKTIGGAVLQDKLENVTSGTRTILPTEYTYTPSANYESASLHIPGKLIEGDVTIDFKLEAPVSATKWYSYNDWYNYCSCGVVNVEADENDIGYDNLKLNVNGQDHKIRLIGLDHDNLADKSAKKVHTTFQFANLLCDENGYSFGVVEDFDQVYEAYNADYLNSILRKDLTGNGDGEIMWFQRGEVNRSDKYKATTVMDMLPKELKKVLKEVKKEIYVGDTEEYDEFIKTDYCDKLFVPTYREMFKEGSEYDGDYYSDEGTTYEYYLLYDSTRIFNQISTDIFVDTPTISDVFHDYGSDAPDNWAGYCSGDPATDACAVFASPDCSLSFQSVLYIYSSTILPMPTTTYALGITPCFCI